MKLPEKVKKVFEEEKYYQFATSSKDSTPNICNIGAVYIREDDKIVIVDNYMLKTKSNILENKKVSILIRKEKESYQIKGLASYIDSGEEYESAKKWMKSKGEKYPAKGAIIIEVVEIFNSNTGIEAGKKVF